MITKNWNAYDDDSRGQDSPNDTFEQQQQPKKTNISR